MDKKNKGREKKERGRRASFDPYLFQPRKNIQQSNRLPGIMTLSVMFQLQFRQLQQGYDRVLKIDFVVFKTKKINFESLKISFKIYNCKGWDAKPTTFTDEGVFCEDNVNNKRSASFKRNADAICAASLLRSDTFTNIQTTLLTLHTFPFSEPSL